MCVLGININFGSLSDAEKTDLWDCGGTGNRMIIIIILAGPTINAGVSAQFSFCPGQMLFKIYRRLIGCAD